MTALESGEQAQDELQIVAACLAALSTDAGWPRKPEEQAPLTQCYRDFVARYGEQVLPAWGTLSPSFEQAVRRWCGASRLFAHLELPTNPYTLPIEGADASARHVPVFEDGTFPELRLGSDGLIHPPIGETTIEARKYASYVRVSTGLSADATPEEQEASIAAFAPYVRAKLIEALADVQDEALMHGNRSGLLDEALPEDHRRRLWDGLRMQARDNGLWFRLPGEGELLGTIRKLRVRMRRYGISPQDLAFVVDSAGFTAMAAMPSREARGGKLAQQAVFAPYEMGRLDGIPIVVPGGTCVGMLNADGYERGPERAHTTICLVNTRQFLFGVRGLPRLVATARDGQLQIFGLRRVGFEAWDRRAPCVGFVTGVPVPLGGQTVRALGGVVGKAPTSHGEPQRLRSACKSPTIHDEGCQCAIL